MFWLSMQKYLRIWLNSFRVYLIIFFFWIHWTRDISTMYVVSFVFCDHMNIQKSQQFRFWTNNFVIRFCLFLFERSRNFRIWLIDRIFLKLWIFEIDFFNFEFFYFQFVIFLIVLSIVSFFGISVWVDTQWMWKILS